MYYRESGEIRFWKELTTPQDPIEAVIAGLKEVGDLNLVETPARDHDRDECPFDSARSQRGRMLPLPVSETYPLFSGVTDAAITI